MNELIAEDMRLPESHFNKGNASRAIQWLNGIVLDDQPNDEPHELLNAFKVIEGYLLRRAALKTKSEHAQAEFCEFMKEEAWWYD